MKVEPTMRDGMLCSLKNNVAYSHNARLERKLFQQLCVVRYSSKQCAVSCRIWHYVNLENNTSICSFRSLGQNQQIDVSSIFL